jgi:putative endonuclease
MVEKTTVIGSWGEKKAEEYLREKGYEILERNWRWQKFEIDLIAVIHNLLVFVEVKARRNSDYGHPESFVSRDKALRIKKASESYQLEKKYNGFIRFDIVSVTGVPSRFEIFHVEDAF